MGSTLQVLDCYERLGISEVWMTPHVMEDIPNGTADLQRRFGEILSAYKGPVKLHLAAEYMLDNGFEGRLSECDLLCIGNSEAKTVLVETSYLCPPIDFYGLLKRIVAKGYKPLLAHPERYMYMEMGDYENLIEMGVRFQCNITSLSDTYGNNSSKKIASFLDRGWVGVLGTDIHRLDSFRFAIEKKCITPKNALRLTEAIGRI